MSVQFPINVKLNPWHFLPLLRPKAHTLVPVVNAAHQGDHVLSYVSSNSGGLVGQVLTTKIKQQINLKKLN